MARLLLSLEIFIDAFPTNRRASFARVTDHSAVSSLRSASSNREAKGPVASTHVACSLAKERSSLIAPWDILSRTILSSFGTLVGGHLGSPSFSLCCLRAGLGVAFENDSRSSLLVFSDTVNSLLFSSSSSSGQINRAL